MAADDAVMPAGFGLGATAGTLFGADLSAALGTEGHCPPVGQPGVAMRAAAGIGRRSRLTGRHFENGPAFTQYLSRWLHRFAHWLRFSGLRPHVRQYGWWNVDDRPRAYRLRWAIPTLRI